MKTLIMIGTGLLLLGFCSMKCFSMHPGLFIEIHLMSAVNYDILWCDCSVLNSLGGIIDQLTVQLNYLYLLLYGY